MFPIIVLFILIILLAVPAVRAQASESAVYTTTMTYDFQNVGSNQAVNARATIYLFGKVTGWGNQEVISESITVNGEKVAPQIFETADNRWTQISLDNFSPGQTKTVKVVQVLKVSAVNLNISPNNVGTTIPAELMVYTQPVARLYESNDPSIQALAKQVSDTSNLYQKAKQLFNLVLESPDNKEHLRYERQPGVEHSALWGLQNKVGDCTEFSNLFVALLRAAGIPAKSVSGFAYLPLYNPTGDVMDAETLGHAYSIFYLPNYGWVPADAVWPRYIGSFGELDYAHIAGASTGGESAFGKDGISWPGPGKFNWNWQAYSGQNTDLSGSWSGTIIPEILVNVSLQPSSQIQDGTLGVTVTIKNMGRSEAKDLVAQLKPDDKYFEVTTEPQRKASLASQNQWVTNFNLKVKEAAYGTTQTLVSEVTFNSSDGSVSGNFLAIARTQLPIAAKPTTTPPGQLPMDNTMLFVLIGVVAVVVVVIAVVVKRR